MILNKLNFGYFTIMNDDGKTLSDRKTYNPLVYETKLNAEKDIYKIARKGIPQDLVFA